MINDIFVVYGINKLEKKKFKKIKIEHSLINLGEDYGRLLFIVKNHGENGVWKKILIFRILINIVCLD